MVLLLNYHFSYIITVTFSERTVQPMDESITQLLSGLLDRTLHLKYTIIDKTSDAVSKYLNQVC